MQGTCDGRRHGGVGHPHLVGEIHAADACAVIGVSTTDTRPPIRDSLVAISADQETCGARAY
jgi:hypothetical protein